MQIVVHPAKLTTARAPGALSLAIISTQILMSATVRYASSPEDILTLALSHLARLIYSPSRRWTSRRPWHRNDDPR